MSKQSGYYNRQFNWLQRSYTLDTESGAQIPTWTNVGTLWGSIVETPTVPGGNAYKEQWGTNRSGTATTIQIQQFPEISAEDRLQDILFDQTYILTAVAIDWPNNQLIVAAYRLQNEPL